MLPLPFLNCAFHGNARVYVFSIIQLLDLKLNKGATQNCTETEVESNQEWYAQRRRTFRLERSPGFSRCAMLLNARISGILPATLKLTNDLIVHTAP